MKRIYPTSNAFSVYLTEQISKIRKSNSFLSIKEKNEWFLSIDSSKSDLNHLQTLPNQQSEYLSAIINQLETAKQFILSFNADLEKAQLKNRLLELQTLIIKAEEDYVLLFQSPRYFSKKEFHEWHENNASLKQPIERALSKGVNELPFRNSLIRLRDVFANGEKLVAERNKRFVEEEIRKSELFPPVEDKTLTEEQRRAIVVDEANTLVVAGAGTGKTTALLGKAQYLVAKGLASPQDILIVSFGADIKEENENKINGNRAKFVGTT